MLNFLGNDRLLNMSAISDSNPLEVELQLPVRTYDIDFAGIVSNIVSSY